MFFCWLFPSWAERTSSVSVKGGGRLDPGERRQRSEALDESLLRRKFPGKTRRRLQQLSHSDGRSDDDQTVSCAEAVVSSARIYPPRKLERPRLRCKKNLSLLRAVIPSLCKGAARWPFLSERRASFSAGVWQKAFLAESFAPAPFPTESLVAPSARPSAAELCDASF